MLKPKNMIEDIGWQVNGNYYLLLPSVSPSLNSKQTILGNVLRIPLSIILNDIF